MLWALIGNWGDVGHMVQISSFRVDRFWDLMNGVASLINDAVGHARKRLVVENISVLTTSAHTSADDAT